MNLENWIATGLTLVTAAIAAYSALLSRLAVQESARQAKAAQHQAELTWEQLELARRPYLLMSPHPSKDEHGNRRGRLINFGNLPIYLTGAWLQPFDTQSKVHEIGVILDYPKATSLGFLQPEEYVDLLLPDWQAEVTPGHWILRVTFEYPTLPQRNHLFEVAMFKRDPEHEAMYNLNQAGYNFEWDGHVSAKPVVHRYLLPD